MKTIENGYSACAGLCGNGWYGGVLVLDGRDKEFLKVPADLSYAQRAAYARRWSELTVGPRREIALVLPEGAGMARHCIAAAERIEGPVTPRERVASPTLVWVERRAGQWHLVLFEQGEVRTILSSNQVMRCPKVASTAQGLLFAFESDAGPHSMQVELVDCQGTALYRAAGREPILCATGDGVALGCEQSSADEVTLQLATFVVDQNVACGCRTRAEPALGKRGLLLTPAATVELQHGDYLLNADMAWSGQENALFIAAESSPRFGYSNQIGLHRTIPTWRWQPGGEAEALGELPVEERAFGSIGAENITPLKPFVLIEEGQPVVGFKQHRYTGFRAFGWDLFWCRRAEPTPNPSKEGNQRGGSEPSKEGNQRGGSEPSKEGNQRGGSEPSKEGNQRGGSEPSEEGNQRGGSEPSEEGNQQAGWTEPVRISEETMTSDSTFGLVQEDGGYVGLFPCHENEGGHGSKHCADMRVELVAFGRGHGLPRFEIPEDKQVDYRIPPACKDVAPEPPELASPYEGRQLIWGDLHIHTIYSKCVAAVDCGPRENIRFARDVLGCRVFALAEHTPHTTGVESTWLYDQLEATAGHDNVILYATEPGIARTRHMNLYSRDRETFEKLERILIAHNHRYPEVLRQMREDLAHDSVFVMRHVHGNAIPDEQILQHFDPHFEVAMEAMQGRGNAMLGEWENSSKFPNPFLDAGCKVGLVGGTDHFREWAPNHFCLTGFWVKEVSQDGVWEAIRNRFTFAMSDSRVAMVTRCKGAPMGETVTLAAGEAMRVSVQASCGHNIRRIALMRDGELRPWVDVGATTATLELTDDDVAPGKHWYVVTAEVDTGHGKDNEGVCHASPYFVWKESK